MRVELGKVREFATAVHARDPMHDGETAVITPTFLTTAGQLWAPVDQDPKEALGFDPGRVLHGEEEFVFHGTLPRVGDRLWVEAKVAERYQKEGSRGGTMRFAVVVSEFRRSDGSLAAEQRSTIIELPGSAPE